MPAFDKDKHIMNKIDGVAVQVNVSFIPVAVFFSLMKTSGQIVIRNRWNGSFKRNYKIFVEYLKNVFYTK